MGGSVINVVLVVLVCQAVSAFYVMRSLRGRDDLGSAARLIPTALTFLIPIVGPLIAGWLLRTRLRPAIVNSGLLAASLGVLALAGGVPTPPGEPQGGRGMASPKAAQAKAEPAEKVEPAPPAATKPDEQPRPVERPQPAVMPQPTAKPQPAEKDQPAAKSHPTASTQPKATPQPAAKPAATTVTLLKTEGSNQPATVVEGMAAQHTMTVNIGPGTTYETQLTSGPYRGGWLSFAAAMTSPPGTGTAARHFYVGGYVRNYDLLTVDRFAPLPIAEADLKPGKEISMGTRRGSYRALLRVDKVTRDTNGALQSVDLLVTIK